MKTILLLILLLANIGQNQVLSQDHETEIILIINDRVV